MHGSRLVVCGAAIAMLGAPASSHAALRGKVSRVKDGDSVAVRIGSHVRTFNLAGLDAPELGSCYGAEAKAKLARLLHRGDRVKVVTRGGRSADISENGSSINRAMVRGGFAKATSSRYESVQGAAQSADRGLWGACEMTPTPSPSPSPSPSPTPMPQPAQGDITGQAAIDRMTAELKGGRWRQFTSGSSGSTEYILNLCADGRFRRTTQGAFGGLLFKTGTWKVTEAQIAGDGSYRAAQVQATITGGDPPPDSATEEHFVGAKTEGGSDTWFWGDSPAQYFKGSATCG